MTTENSEVTAETLRAAVNKSKPPPPSEVPGEPVSPPPPPPASTSATCDVCGDKGIRPACPSCGRKVRGRKPKKVAERLEKLGDDGFIFDGPPPTANREKSTAPESPKPFDGPTVKLPTGLLAETLVGALDGGSQALAAGMTKRLPDDVRAQIMSASGANDDEKKNLEKIAKAWLETMDVNIHPGYAFLIYAGIVYVPKHVAIMIAVRQLGGAK